MRDQLKDRLHVGCAGNELGHAFGAKQAILQLKLARAAQGLMQFGMDADQRNEPIVFPRLLNEVARAALDAIRRRDRCCPRRSSR